MSARGAAVALLLAAPIAWAGLPAPGTPGAPSDPRYCGEPRRDGKGRIVRSTAERNRFMAMWPKPRDGRQWYVDHVLPMSRGGCDRVGNMQWLPAEIKLRKNCRSLLAKDCFEREVYR